MKILTRTEGDEIIFLPLAGPCFRMLFDLIPLAQPAIPGTHTGYHDPNDGGLRRTVSGGCKLVPEQLLCHAFVHMKSDDLAAI
jgi:hypothetical protein